MIELTHANTSPCVIFIQTNARVCLNCAGNNIYERAGRNGMGKEDNMTDYFSKEPTLRISMQYFADPEGGEGEAENNAAGTDDARDGEKQGSQEPPTLKELLASNKAYQSEFDKMSSKAQETAIANARAKWEADAKAQADEAAKLAKMKTDEKAEYERQKREDELAKREADITRRELHAEAVTQLTEKGLPASLADILDCTSAENCKKSMEKVEKAFNEAVEKSVNSKLKGTTPKSGGGKTSGDAFLMGLGVN